MVRAARVILLMILTAVLAAGVLPAPATAIAQVRFATFNASLNRASAGELLTDLSTPDDAAGPQGRPR